MIAPELTQHGGDGSSTESPAIATREVQSRQSTAGNDGE